MRASLDHLGLHAADRQRAGDLEVHRDQAVRFYSANVRGFAHVPITVTPRAAGGR